MVTINDLTDEILLEIFKYIDIVKRTRLERVCQRWRFIIQRMWHPINKLKFTLVPRYAKRIIHRENITSGVNLQSKNIENFTGILRKFNGKINQLHINDYLMDKWNLSDEICQLISQNESLISIQISSAHSDIIGQILKCLSVVCLRHISILNKYYFESDNGVCDALEKITMKQQALSYLYIYDVTPKLLKSISSITTLKSLHLGRSARCSNLDCLFGSTSQLSNLESFSIADTVLIDDVLLNLLADKCPEIRALSLRLQPAKCSEFGFSAIGKLKNLRYLKLMGMKYHSFLRQLVNLEELYCLIHSNYKSLEELAFVQSVIHNLPSIKKCNLFNAFILALMGTDEAQRAKLTYVEDLCHREWNKIFGAVQSMVRK